MRYIVNDKNYVVAISFGCDMLYNDCVCNEYTGVIPSGYESLEEWYLEEELTLWRWKITDGNLTLDSSATAPEEGQWGVPDLQDKTVTPTTSEQDVTADEDYDGLRKVTVKGIPESYVKPSSTHDEQTIIPGINDQYIEAGTYCSGKQTIQGDADLVASNIKAGVSIFGVAGSYQPIVGETKGCNAASDLLNFNLQTKNLLGFYIYSSISTSSSKYLGDTTKDEWISHAFFWNFECISMNRLHFDVTHPYVSCQNLNDSITCNVYTSRIELELTSSAYKFAATGSYYLVPIYSE